MDFTFSEDQILFRDSVREFLSNEVSAESLRERWDVPGGRSKELWAALAELGLTGMLVSEANGGLGMNEIDFVLLAEECGRAALPEPLVDTVLVATPILQEAGMNDVLSAIATGDSAVAVQPTEGALLADAEFSDYLIVQQGSAVYLMKSADATLELQESVDPGRRLYSVSWQPDQATMLADGNEGAAMQARLFNRGALGAAAQLLGLSQRMIELSVNYTSERNQFGKPIGSFQAVKHHMANVAVKTEFAKAPVYRAAYSVTHNLGDAAQHVSHAKLAATEAATLAAKSGIQVHGAMGYTWEVDLQIFMKRAWALAGAWGSRGEHKARVASAVFGAERSLGAGQTFASAS
ncbi:MAG: acyl-CoA dehydrogenase family protein [Pseudomonadales bacterium]